MIENVKAAKINGKTVFESLEIGYFRRIDKIFKENEACFMYLEQGALELRTPAEHFKIDIGDAILAKCSNFFFEQKPLAEAANPHTTKVVSAYFFPDIVKPLFEADLDLSKFRTPYNVKKMVMDEAIRQFFKSIEILLDHPEMATEALLKTKLRELLILLSYTEAAPSVADFVASLFKPHEYDFRQVVEQNLYANLSIDEFAYLCSTSPATFKRHFKEIFGEPPARYILKKKMEKALQLLQTPRVRIADVAFDCGFESVPSFNRAFRQHYGKTPGEAQTA